MKVLTLRTENKAFASCPPELDEKSLLRLRLEPALRKILAQNKKSVRMN